VTSQWQRPCVEASWRAFVRTPLARVSRPGGGAGQGHAARLVPTRHGARELEARWVARGVSKEGGSRGAAWSIVFELLARHTGWSSDGRQQSSGQRWWDATTHKEVMWWLMVAGAHVGILATEGGWRVDGATAGIWSARTRGHRAGGDFENVVILSSDQH
jgi:hypothetical protein